MLSLESALQCEKAGPSDALCSGASGSSASLIGNYWRMRLNSNMRAQFARTKHLTNHAPHGQDNPMCFKDQR